MSKIELNIIDMAGNRFALPLPHGKPLHDLIPAIVTMLDLTNFDIEGQSLHYQLFSPRLQRVLSLNGTLYSNGILAGDGLWIVPCHTSRELEFELLDEPNPGARIAIPEQPRVTIGRGPENDIAIRHPAVSRQHGELIWQDGLHIYRDLNSANGSYINNQIVTEPMPIATGSILNLGEAVRLVYQPIRHPAPSTATSSTSSNTDRMSTSLNPLPRGIVYMSYAPSDLSLTTGLVNYLRGTNFHIFWDQEIPTGSNLQEAMLTGLKLADAMVVILTPEAVATQMLVDQWHEFVLMRKPMIGVIYSPCTVPNFFENSALIEFQGDFNHLCNEVVVALNQFLR